MKTETLANDQTPSIFMAWILASRPKTLTAGFVPIAVASALAYCQTGQFNMSVAICALCAAILIQIGTNLVNDALDFKKGADTAERLGPLRVTQAGLLPPKQVLGMGFACFALAVLAALPLAFLGGMPMIAVLVVSVLCGYLYTGGPYPLAYVGLGDLFVVLFFGCIATASVYFLQTGAWTLPSVVVGLQAGLLAAVMIAINNLRDREQDIKASKKTFAVRFGVKVSKAEILLFIFLPFVLNAYWWMTGMQYAACLPMATLPLACVLGLKIVKTAPSREYNALLGMAALLHMAFGIMLTGGFLL